MSHVSFVSFMRLVSRVFPYILCSMQHCSVCGSSFGVGKASHRTRARMYDGAYQDGQWRNMKKVFVGSLNVGQNKQVLKDFGMANGLACWDVWIKPPVIGFFCF